MLKDSSRILAPTRVGTTLFDYATITVVGTAETRQPTGLQNVEPDSHKKRLSVPFGTGSFFTYVSVLCVIKIGSGLNSFIHSIKISSM